jgi:hypothetical protein
MDQKNIFDLHNITKHVFFFKKKNVTKIIIKNTLKILKTL